VAHSPKVLLLLESPTLECGTSQSQCNSTYTVIVLQTGTCRAKRVTLVRAFCTVELATPSAPTSVLYDCVGAYSATTGQLHGKGGAMSLVGTGSAGCPGAMGTTGNT
jgi:hypothetical protein